VDIAVAGLATEQYFDALGELMAMFGAPVDLVLIEEASDSLLQRLAAEGKEL